MNRRQNLQRTQLLRSFNCGTPTFLPSSTKLWLRDLHHGRLRKRQSRRSMQSLQRSPRDRLLQFPGQVTVA